MKKMKMIIILTAFISLLKISSAEIDPAERITFLFSQYNVNLMNGGDISFSFMKNLPQISKPIGLIKEILQNVYIPAAQEGIPNSLALAFVFSYLFVKLPTIILDSKVNNKLYKYSTYFFIDRKKKINIGLNLKLK